MVRLIFHPEAKNELRAAAARYEDKRHGLGQEFLSEVRGIAAKIRQNPLRCSFVSPSYRCCRVKRFPYGIIYRVDDDQVVIAAVMPFKRKPGYRKQRASPG